MRISNKKLKAIVFTDIVNFTQLSAEDEQYALDIIDKQRNILKPIVLKYNGEWLKEIGDGLLLSFDSSLDAVRCSIKIQETLKEVDEFKIRIGIHQGDIFVKDGDVFGDDVNITSRIEGFSPEGGVSISDKVYKDISGVKDIKTSFIGHKPLKGVSQETKVRCITSNNLPKYKVSIIPRLNIFLSFMFGIQMFLLSLIFAYQYLTEGHVYVFYTDFEYIILALNTSIIFILFGYSSLSYTRGISIKSQKALLYFSYFYTTYYLYNEMLTGLISQLFSEDMGYPIQDAMFIIWTLCILVLIPLAVIFIFKLFFKKRF